MARDALAVAPRSRACSALGVVVRIFAQGPPRLDLARFLGAARQHFSASLEVRSADQELRSAVLHLESARHGYAGTYAVRVRAAEDADYIEADAAEARGRAAGMAALARRCASVWEVAAERAGDSNWDEPALVNLCAILASVALGPVLPEDGSTLLGVRSAMERVEKLVGVRTLLR